MNAGIELTIETIDGIRRFLQPLMDGFPSPWCVAGGWAVDLFLGCETRPHADVELAIFRQDQMQVRRHLRDWTFVKVVDGQRVEWSDREHLELPIHEIHARPKNGSSRGIEFLLNERDARNWIYRRNSSIQMPIEDAIVQSQAGLPVLAPEIVLLFKSKSPREKDDADFRSASSSLDTGRRRWLAQAIAAVEPEHPWLQLLASDRPNDDTSVIPETG